jgi:hypothetical protein
VMANAKIRNQSPRAAARALAKERVLTAMSYRR